MPPNAATGRNITSQPNPDKDHFVKSRGRSVTKRQTTNSNRDKPRSKSLKPRGHKLAIVTADGGSPVRPQHSENRSQMSNSRSASRVGGPKDPPGSNTDSMRDEQQPPYTSGETSNA